jgi:FkbM family methyltransferase
MEPLTIRMKDCDVMLAVPPSLTSITTYILLEQERWFEKELSFLARWLKPGMTAIDIGANLGVYALPMARLVGPSGRVVAYEPGSEARSLLERSRELNAAANLRIVGAALSDSRRQGSLARGASTELNVLGVTGDGEPVDITTLDDELDRDPSLCPDFIKIDAEGEEERILAGGRTCLCAPFSLAHGRDSVGGQDPRQSPDRSCADGPSPVSPAARRPDPGPVRARRARSVRAQSVRRESRPARIAVCRGRRRRLDPAMGASGGRRATRIALPQAAAVCPDVRECGHQLSQRRSRICDGPGGVRGVADREPAGAHALRRAMVRLSDACRPVQSLAHHGALLHLCPYRVGWRMVGRKRRRLEADGRLHQACPFRPSEPCWPANPRFDDIPGADNPAQWFATGIMEQLERMSGYSSYFNGTSPSIGWLSQQPLASREMQRRKVLSEASKGASPSVPPALREPASDHLNADLWRDGKVPGTRLDT